MVGGRGRKKTNQHKQLLGIVPGMSGGLFVFMCCPFFFLGGGGKGKHINKIPRKSEEKAGTVLGQSQDNPVKIMFVCFVVYCFSCPQKESGKRSLEKEKGRKKERERER